MKDYEKPLHWGLTYKQMRELLESLGYSFESWQNRATIDMDKIALGGITLTSWVGDCGVLLVSGANYATKKVLDDIHTIASKCGFSKMLATVVGGAVSNAATTFTEQPLWKLVASGKSNRSSGRSDDYVFVYYNENCEYKGH